MRYSKPEMRQFFEKGVSGDPQACVPGSAAAGEYDCTVGNGDAWAPSGKCYDGAGAGFYCNVGTGAADAGCSVGNSAETFCVTGGTP